MSAPGNLAEALERDRWPLLVLDTTRMDAPVELRPGAVWRMANDAVSYLTPPHAPGPWEAVRRWLEGDDP